MSDKKLQFVEVNEQSRRYIFPTGDVRINNVVRIAISDTTHRLETLDGRKFIVPEGWLAIELAVENWTF